MRKFLILFVTLFCTTAIAHTINWYVDSASYHTTTCESGDNITPPTPPVKYGYHFVRWSPYTPIEYLESTGTQYIDTGIYGNLNTTWIVDFMSIVPSSTHGSAIIGGDIDSQTRAISILLTLGNNRPRTCRFGDKSVEQFPQNVVFNNQRYTVKTNKDAIMINNSVVARFNTTTPFVTANTLLFPGCRQLTESFTIRIYASQIYDDDTLVRDFIPVLDLNGVACMYDKVSNTFFYNAGTGQFIAGPIITE